MASGEPRPGRVEICLELDWAEHGDEWLQHLNWHLHIDDKVNFGGSDPGLFDHIELHSGEEGLYSLLVVQRRDDGRIVCTIFDDGDPDFGDGAEPLADQIGPWRQAVLDAAAMVGTLAPAVWNAVLGVRPQLRLRSFSGVDSRPGALTAPAGLGPLQLMPGGTTMHEMAQAHPDQIDRNRFPATSWPLIIQGHVTSRWEGPDRIDRLSILRDIRLGGTLHGFRHAV